MAVSKSSATPQPSQKKQQSISSFFSQKGTALPPKQTPVVTRDDPPVSQSRRTEATQRESLFVPEAEEDEDDLPVRSSKRSLPKRDWSFHAGKENVPQQDETHEFAPPSPKRRKVSADEGTNASRALPSPGRTEAAAPSPPRILRRESSSAKVTERTSKYIFSTDKVAPDEQEDDLETTQRKQDLHRRFVERLGDPSTLAQIKRRNGFIEDPMPEGEEEADDEDIEDDEPTPRSKGAMKKTTAEKEKKMTPMESQFIDIKRKNMDTLLIVEVGYKYKFFGEDARHAAKELSIVCIPGEMRFDKAKRDWYRFRMASASIPVHRLHVHVKRLIAAGHKVGVVRQIETAALKAAGDNRNTPFERKLTNVYTKGTYIDDVETLDADAAGPSGGAPASGHLLCITETKAKGWGTDEKVHFGIVAVQPGTGDIIYDDFEDGFMRTEVETRLLHIAPCEFLIVGEMSKASEKLIKHLSGSKTNVFGDKARVERTDKSKTAAAQSYSHISNFYAEKLKDASGSAEITGGKLLDKVHKLSELVSICLSAMINHLTSYGLQHVFNLTKNFQPFGARSYMLLNGNTLSSLEIYRNQTDNTEKGSLFWVLDQTSTRFGQRLLRKWVGRPLLDKARLKERADAVEELNEVGKAAHVAKLKEMLVKTKSDLEKSLIRIYYGKATRPEVLSMLQTLQRIASEYAHVESATTSGFAAELLGEAIASLPRILDDVLAELERINPEAAKADEKESFFRDEHSTDDINNHKAGIAIVEQELDEHRADAAAKLKKKSVSYVTVSGIEYLIEVENDKVSLKNVPASWQKQSGTKKHSRFHTPQVTRLIQQRAQHKEALAAACDAAFATLLASISAKYQIFRNAVHSLATLDCLLSLATVAARPGYCKPDFSEQTEIAIEGGRHPMIEQLLLSSYVPNSTLLSHSTTSALLITGPNMGGKSSYVRHVALLCIMAQIGSHVPATSATLGMLDAVHTRMGANDNMMAGESTFMVELSETADILRSATPRSLIILDELGRGTSTHDGVAIAQAVLDWIVRERKGLLLFITHYQSLGAVAGAFGDTGRLRNVHMRFTEEDDRNSGADSHEQRMVDENEERAEAHAFHEKDITFLYEVGDGMAHRSYGLNVARLAKLPKGVIDVARVKSKELEMDVKRAKVVSALRSMQGYIAGDGSIDIGELEALTEALEQL